MQGVPFRLDNDLRIFYDGTFFGLLNPFALLCGLLSVAMLVTHGATWLEIKTTDAVADRVRLYGCYSAIATFILFAAGGLALWLGVDGYHITSAINTEGPSNPLAKTVALESNAWFANYEAHPWLLIAPACGFLGTIIAFFGLSARREIGAFMGSTLAVFGIIATVGVSMFPFILPSSVQPQASLTVWDASSSHLTLFIMLAATAIFLPIILAYTAWVYHVLWGKVEEKDIKDKSSHAY